MSDLVFGGHAILSQIWDGLSPERSRILAKRAANGRRMIGISIALYGDSQTRKPREVVVKRWLYGVLVLCLSVPAAPQEKQPPQEQQPPYVERVEVRVRSVLVFITDAKGKPLVAAPSPADLRVTEDGKPVEVLAVEPARPAATAPSTTATTGDGATATPVVREAAAVPQYLYLDTTSLQVRSVPRIVETLDRHLESLLASGPLEVVVADPDPKVALPSTRDVAAIRATLKTLPTTAVGKQRIYESRRDSLTQMLYDQTNRGTTSGPSRPELRTAIRQEMALITTSLDRLDTWAATLPYDRASVVYLCNDGFDGDLTEVYRKVLNESLSFEDHQAAMQLQMEFGRDAANITARAGDILAGRGATAIVLAFGNTDSDFATSAANQGKLGTTAIRRPTNSMPINYFARPNEPLLAIADRTGGEVVSVDSKLPRALDDVGGAYLVSFRSHAPADGHAHPLEITSASSAIRVRAPRAVLAATPQAASAGQAVRALSTPSGAGSLPVTAAIADAEKAEKDRMRGRLEVSADLGSIAEALETLGPGRIRVTVAVENTKGAPFTRSEEAELDHSGQGTMWSYEANITWPPDATRVAVTIEELKTGARGSAVAELPKD